MIIKKKIHGVAGAASLSPGASMMSARAPAVCNAYLCNASSCCPRRPLYLRRMQKVLSVKQWFRSETRLQAHFVRVKIKVLLQTST